MKIDNVRVFNFEGAIRGCRNPLNSWDKSDSRFGMDNCPLEDNSDFTFVFDKWREQAKKITPVENSFASQIQTIVNEVNQATYYAAWLKLNGHIHTDTNNDVYEYAYIGPADLGLMTKLILAGPEHAKFLRQIQVSFDLTAPLYLWKELDTYKIGTTANSTSTMHKLASTPITLDCFEIGDYIPDLKSMQNVDYDYPAEDSIKYIIEDIIDFLEALRLKYLETKDQKYWKELIRWLPESWLQTRTITANYAVLRNIYHQRKGHKLTEWKYILDAFEKFPYAYELIVN